MVKPGAVQQQSPVLTFVSEDSITLKVGPVRQNDTNKLGAGSEDRRAPREPSQEGTEPSEDDAMTSVEDTHVTDSGDTVGVLSPTVEKRPSGEKDEDMEVQHCTQVEGKTKPVEDVRDFKSMNTAEDPANAKTKLESVLPGVNCSNTSVLISVEDKCSATQKSVTEQLKEEKKLQNDGVKNGDVSLASLLASSKTDREQLPLNVPTMLQTKTVTRTNVLASNVLSSSALKTVASTAVPKSTPPSNKAPVSASSVLSQILKPAAPATVANTNTKVKCTEKEHKPPSVPLFRLGMEGNYSLYVNQYSTNTFALNKHQHMEQKDKRRAVANKFSLNEFKWHNGEVYGDKEVILNTLRYSIIGLENAIPTAFMHPAWPIQRSTWIRAIQLAATPQEFSAILSFLEDFIKPICYVSVWGEAAGHMELHRITTADSRKRSKKSNKEEEEEEEEIGELNRELGKPPSVFKLCPKFSLV